MAKAEWTKQIYTVKEVVYDLGLPQTVMVEAGFYSKDEQLSMASGDVVDFMSVTEKQYIQAATRRTESNTTKNFLIPFDSSSLIHVSIVEGNPEVFNPVNKAIEKAPNYFRLNRDIEAVDTTNENIYLHRGAYLESLQEAKGPGLPFRYRGSVIYLQNQSVLDPQKSIYELKEAVKKFSFPFQGYFVEGNSNSDKPSGCLNFLRVETKRFLSCSSVLLGDSGVRCSVMFTEMLLPMDSEQVMETEVRVKEQIKYSKNTALLRRNPRQHNFWASQDNYYYNQKSASQATGPKRLDLSVLEQSKSKEYNAFTESKIQTDRAENKFYEMANSVVRDIEKKKKGKPPVPPLRMNSVLSMSDDAKQCPSDQDSFTYMRLQRKDATAVSKEPPQLPPRRPPKTFANGKCDITLKSGTSDVPISLKILTNSYQKDIPQNPETDNSESLTHSDSDDGDDTYMKMQNLISLRTVTRRPIPEKHRDSLFKVHDELKKRGVPPKSRHPLPPIPRKMPQQPSVSVSEASFTSQKDHSLTSKTVLSHTKPTHIVSPNVRRGQDDTSTADVKDFCKMSVEEVVECFKVCKLPKMADVCFSENLDGSFLVNLTSEELSVEPFCLSSFHIKKLEQIKNGWRPSHNVA